MNGHGYVLPPSRHVGPVLSDLDVSTCVAWSTGHSANHSLVTRSRGPSTRAALTLCGWCGGVAPLVGQTSWVNPCVVTHREHVPLSCGSSLDMFLSLC